MSKAERNEELFAEFFNHESIEVAAMDFATLESHINDLENIAFEARTRLQSATKNKKDRIFSLSQEERDKLISQPDFTSSERSKLELPKRAKVSKADKMQAEFLAMGMSTEEVDALLANVRVKEEAEDRKANPHKYLVDGRLRDKSEDIKPDTTNRVKVTQDSLFRECINLIDLDLIKKATVDLMAVATCGLPLDSVNMITHSRSEAVEKLSERYETVKLLAPKAAKELGVSVLEYVNGVLKDNILTWYLEAKDRDPSYAEIVEPTVEPIAENKANAQDKPVTPDWLPKF